MSRKLVCDYFKDELSAPGLERVKERSVAQFLLRTLSSYEDYDANSELLDRKEQEDNKKANNITTELLGNSSGIEEASAEVQLACKEAAARFSTPVKQAEGK